MANIIFYPQNFTTGFTIEAKGFQRLSENFSDLNSKVIVISVDLISKYKEFCNDIDINFILPKDSDVSLGKLYGSWVSGYSEKIHF